MKSFLRNEKSDRVLPTARHHCDISSKGAVLPGRNDAEMGPANSLHASAYYSEYNERFDLKLTPQVTFKKITIEGKKPGVFLITRCSRIWTINLQSTLL